jgi:hypothetical protein
MAAKSENMKSGNDVKSAMRKSAKRHRWRQYHQAKISNERKKAAMA